MIVKVMVEDGRQPAGKVADAELHFGPLDGVLDGLKLIGFGVWERRNALRNDPSEARYNVTFPARQYSVNGERRSFALLRPIVDAAGQERIRAAVISAYLAAVEADAEAMSA